MSSLLSWQPFVNEGSAFKILEVGLPMSKFQVDPTKKWTESSAKIQNCRSNRSYEPVFMAI